MEGLFKVVWTEIKLQLLEVKWEGGIKEFCVHSLNSSFLAHFALRKAIGCHMLSLEYWILRRKPSENDNSVQEFRTLSLDNKQKETTNLGIKAWCWDHLWLNPLYNHCKVSGLSGLNINCAFHCHFPSTWAVRCQQRQTTWQHGPGNEAWKWLILALHSLWMTRRWRDRRNG